MSDDYLRLIPTDPHFVPAPASAERARQLLEELVPEADEVTVVVTDDVEFIDQGENFEGIWCPRCKSKLDKDWWWERVDEAEATGFADLEVSVPCCGATLSLNDLGYEMPAGFARFVLEAMNPNVTDLPDTALTALSAALGTPLRKIWARY